MSTVDRAARDQLNNRLKDSDENWFYIPRGQANDPPKWYFDILARILVLANGEDIVCVTSGVDFNSEIPGGAILALTQKAVVSVDFRTVNGALGEITSSVFLRSRISEVELVSFNPEGNPTEVDDYDWRISFVRDDGKRYALPMAIGHTNASREVANLFPSLLADMGKVGS
jgi:hypothetical protein